MKKSIALLGSTGSIGQSTLRVARHLSDSIAVKALAAHSNIALLEEQIREFHPEMVAVFDEAKAHELGKKGLPVKIVAGPEGIEEVASYAAVSFVVVAIVGTAALLPTLRAIESGKGIGLANKEVLVAAGEWLTALAREKGVPLIPIDSEHSALFQCLQGEDKREIRRLILTASGGPFRTHSSSELEAVTVDEALAHPTWSMGPKVTVDSSTLMNKGFEMIEARWLFDMPPEKIEVIIHPQSVIHSMVECVDGSLLAQLSEPNMIFPIQYALTYPERKPGLFPPFDFIKNHTLTFFPPDVEKFPSLALAYESLRIGKSATCYLNAANEVLVERFLRREISWVGIMKRLEKLMGKHKPLSCDTMENVLCVDREAREEARHS